MQRLIARIPLPMGGLALGAAGLGNLLGRYNQIVWCVCGLLSLVLLTLLIIRILSDLRTVASELASDQVTAAAFAAICMAAMLLSDYLSVFSHTAGSIVWCICTVFFLIYALWFTWHHMPHLKPKEVQASFLLPYAGMMLVAVSSVPFGEHYSYR